MAQISIQIEHTRLVVLATTLKSWFAGDEAIRKIGLTNRYLSNGKKNIDFMDLTLKYDDKHKNTSIYGKNPNGIFRMELSNHQEQCRTIELIRVSDVLREEAKKFLKIIYFTSFLEANGGSSEIDATMKTRFEVSCIRKINECMKIFDVREELARALAVTSDVDIIPPGFRMIYQTSHDDLERFDKHFSEAEATQIQEKIELGLRLMEKGNNLRIQYKGQHKTFEVSTKTKITVYFPRPDDNILECKYSYPRAAIHTARILSKYMFDKGMCSALGLSIGWDSLIKEDNLKVFLTALTVDNTILPGVTKLRAEDQSIFYLVTIPRVRPHKYLDLTKAEGLIFVIFSMINDFVINMKNNKSVTTEISASFTSDTISKLRNLNMTYDDLETHTKAIFYAVKVCILNIKRKGNWRGRKEIGKGIAPLHTMNMMRKIISEQVTNNPDKFKESDLTTRQDFLHDLSEASTSQEGSSSST